MPSPTVFISYSWDNDSHQAWVVSLADYLKSTGVNVLVDKDQHLGRYLPKFMEQSIARADYVLIICTERYKQKADAREGGVGYESNIISGDLFATSGLSEEKYIPILRSGSWNSSLPVYLAGKLGVDCSSGVISEVSMRDLLTTLKVAAPKKTSEQYTPEEYVNGNCAAIRAIDEKENEDIKITGIILDKVTQPRMDGTRGSALYTIPFQLNKYPPYEWRQLFIQAWNMPPRFSTMHRPGIASVRGDTIVLNGTTIDEVEEHHRDTLILCVEQANQQYEEITKQREQAERQKKLREEEQRRHVADVAKRIEF